MQQKISITGISSISPLGVSSGDIWKAYKDPSHRISFKDFEGEQAPIALLSQNAKQKIKELRAESSHYEALDDSVLFGVFAARQAVKNAGWHGDVILGLI